MKKIVIFGAGEGSVEILKVVIEDINLFKPSWEFIGFVDGKKSIQNQTIHGYPVFGSVNEIEAKNLYGACGVMDNMIRKKIIFDEIMANQIKLATLIHPSVTKTSDLAYNEGLIIFPGCRMSYNVKFGMGVIINYNCVLCHDQVIKDFTKICPTVTIAGQCTIGESCTIGASATLIQGVLVDDNATVGIGSTVIKNVDKNIQIMDLPRKFESKKR